jgi:WG containing repeat
MNLYYLRSILTIVFSVFSFQIFADNADSLSVSKGHVRKFFNVEKTQKIMMATLAKPTPFYNRDSLLKHFKQFFANPDLTNYQNYVEAMSVQLKKKITILEYDDIRNVFQLEQLTDLRGRYSLVNSAICLVNKQEGHFIRVKDSDGIDIMTEPLENVEKYQSVDIYNQGFARVKQGKVGYGFLNICGEEIVKCQYSQAENFNNGKALVMKNNNWHFVDAKGQETNVLKNVIDAIALAKGISLVRFKDGKYALIDNLFDKTEAPVSDIYDSIEPLQYDRFKVKIGSELKIINLETTEVRQFSVNN